jgi:hypothetical protein
MKTFSIFTHNSEKPKKATFNIQSKGLHSGRPLKNPIPNCFAVITEESQLFELVYSLYISKKFERLLIGSVIPFIRIAEAQILIKTFAPIANKKRLSALAQVDQFVQQSEKKYKTALQLRQVFALEALRN